MSSGVFATQPVGHKRKGQFKPHWLTSNCPANDVTPPTPALPLYEWLAGQPAPVVEQVKGIKQRILAKELSAWADGIKPLLSVANAINPIPVQSELVNIILTAVREYELKSASNAVQEHISNVVGGVSQELQATVERAILSLPNGKSIFEKVADSHLYGLSLEKNGDDNFELAIDSVDFFQHFYADVELVPQAYRPYYAFLLKTLMGRGLGEMQINVIEYYGGIDPVSPGRAKIIRRFVEKLRESQDKDDTEEHVKSILSAYSRCKTIERFLLDVEEVCSYGDDMLRLLVDDYESAMNFLDEGIDLLEYATKYRQIMEHGELTLEALLAIEDDGSDYMKLFKAVAGAFHGLPMCESAISLRDERVPFGVIISPMREIDVTDEVERRLSNLWEGFCNNAEDLESWVINLSNPDWMLSVKNAIVTTGLAFALIEGVSEIRKVA